MPLTAEVKSGDLTLSDTITVTTTNGVINRGSASKLEIVGPPSVPNGSFSPAETYLGILTYPDGTKRVASSVNWTRVLNGSSNQTSTQASKTYTISNGSFSSLLLSASYSDSGTVLSSSKSIVTTSVSTAALTEISIVGPSHVAAGVNSPPASYTVNAFYADGYQRASVSPVNWSAVADDGTLQVQSNSSFAISNGDFNSLRLTAQYSFNGVTASTSRTIVATTIKDPYYLQQPYLFSPEISQGGINVEEAWKLTTGDPNLVIGIIDMGVLNHTDLAGRLIAGYNFVEGNANSVDPGGIPPSAGCLVVWHGTGVGGIIGMNNNSIGGVGVNWKSKLLPVRSVYSFMGTCNFTAQDPNTIAKAIRRASGLSVAGSPLNPNPAKVLNMSLIGADACTTTAMQSAIADAAVVGTTVVISAGNQGAESSNYGLCPDAVWVSATDQDGGKASFTNTGTGVTIAAPGVSIVVPKDSGTTTANNDNTFSTSNGTSQSAPLVTGVISLMLSVNPSLTPKQIKQILLATARSFPTNVTVPCTNLLCGAGIVDAAAAVKAASAMLPSIQLASGWNLVGNSVSSPITVSSFFGDASQVVSLWKWVASGTTIGITYPTWAFYSPSQSDGGQAYATIKGYDFLSTINAGEGFWINAKTSFNVVLPTASSVPATAFQNMSSGWHLVSTGEIKTPAAFIADVAATTLWAWDNAQSKWYFYAPSLQAQGGSSLSDYIKASGYLDFTSTNKALGAGVGFWVYKP